MRRAAAAATAFAAALAAPATAEYTPGELAAAIAVARTVAEPVHALASDAYDGRGSGTPGGALAGEFLIDALAALGPGLDETALGRDAYRQRFDGFRTNVLGWIPGTTRADEYVVVGAHYDHFPPGECAWLGDGICNGATDNASGVAIVLAIGRAMRALPVPPERSVVLALWDGEELGLLGSRHFTEAPLVPLDRVTAYLNFDIQGANLAPSLRTMSFAVGAESGGTLLQQLTEQAIAATPLETRRLSVTFGQARSDFHPFWASEVPVVFFSDATNACYHTTADEVDVVDFRKLAHQAEIGFRLALALAESEQRPAFTPLAALATYDDLLVLAELLERELADLPLLDPVWRDDLVELEALARQRVSAGPQAFQAGDALTLAQGAISIATSALPCDPLLVPEPGAAGAAAAAWALGALARGVARPPRRRGAPRQPARPCPLRE